MVHVYKGSTIRTAPEVITLSDICQTHKDKYHMISFIYGVLKNALVEVKSITALGRGWGRRRAGGNGE